MTVAAVEAPVVCDLAVAAAAVAAAVVAAAVACDLAAPVVAVVAQLICIVLTAVELKLHSCWLCIARGTLVAMVAAVEVVTLAQVTKLSSCQRIVVRSSRG